MGVIINGKGNGQTQFSLLLFVCHFLSFPFPFFSFGFTQNYFSFIPLKPYRQSPLFKFSSLLSRLPPSFYFSGHFIHLPPLDCFVRLPTSAASSSSQTHDSIGLLCLFIQFDCFNSQVNPLLCFPYLPISCLFISISQFLVAYFLTAAISCCLFVHS